MYYLAPKCLYRGEYKRILPRVLSPSKVRGCMSGVLRIVSHLCLPPASPFIVQGEAQGYRVQALE